jgi:hypothetical protein
MNVNGLELPDALQRTLRSGAWMRRGRGFSGRWRNPHHLALFKKLFPRIPHPIPELFDYDEMVQVNTMWQGPHDMKFYRGEPSTDYPPGDVDPQRLVIIGESEPDSPIALDYRTIAPRIVYFCDVGNKTLWIEAAPDIETFMSALEL